MNLVRFFLTGAAGVALAAVLCAADGTVQTSVFSRTAREYHRKKQPDGSFTTELYALSNGGLAPGTVKDDGLDHAGFKLVGGVLQRHLADQNYILAPDSASAQLLLVVQWGRTIPFNGGNYSTQVNSTGAAMSRLQSVRQSTVPTSANSPEQAQAVQGANEARNQEMAQASAELEGQLLAMHMENQARDQIAESNARLLGYIGDINDANDISRLVGGADRYDGLRADVEESRYYIVLLAYDFRRAVEKKELKLYWVTRISIRVQGNQFEKSLEAMVARASRYFGRDSGKLVRDYEGTVELGEPEVIGVVGEPSSTGNAESAGESEKAGKTE